MGSIGACRHLKMDIYILILQFINHLLYFSLIYEFHISLNIKNHYAISSRYDNSIIIIEQDENPQNR